MGQAAEAGDAREFAMGPTTVTIGHDGAVTGVRHPRRDHSMLLAEGVLGPEGSMHDAAHRWGKGFAILDGPTSPGSRAFCWTPATWTWPPG